MPCGSHCGVSTSPGGRQTHLPLGEGVIPDGSVLAVSILLSENWKSSFGFTLSMRPRVGGICFGAGLCQGAGSMILNLGIHLVSPVLLGVQLVLDALGCRSAPWASRSDKNGSPGAVEALCVFKPISLVFRARTAAL